MEDKICYIINFYFGERRKTIEKYTNEDRLFFYKKQIEFLEKYSHSLSKIIFTCNIEKADYKYVSELFKITPKYIQNAEIEIHFRENYGLSYGGWADAYDRNEDEYDYFIFNEDDYFFCQNNWDSYLANKFNSYDDAGFLCMAIREPQEWNDYKKHAGHAASISSNQVLKKIKEVHGALPHGDKKDYHSNERLGQINQTFSSLELGYNIYDIRDDFRVSFAWTGNDGRDTWRMFWWNEKDLIVPAILIEPQLYNWYESYDEEFLKDYNPTSNIEAIYYYENKKNYYEK
jgi:hypothetical protein